MKGNYRGLPRRKLLPIRSLRCYALLKSNVTMNTTIAKRHAIL
jgi:hypothetical protein